eukprot:4581527-Amphidinium_carterae.1
MTSFVIPCYLLRIAAETRCGTNEEPSRRSDEDNDWKPTRVNIKLQQPLTESSLELKEPETKKEAPKTDVKNNC